MIFGFKFEADKNHKQLLRNYVKETDLKIKHNVLLGSGYAHFLNDEVVFVNTPKPFPAILKYIAFILGAGFVVFFGFSWWLVFPALIFAVDLSSDYAPALLFSWGLHKKGVRLRNKLNLSKEEILNYLEGKYVTK